MGKIIFTMLYKKSVEENPQMEIERFELTHFVAIFLLILLTAIAIVSPDILYQNIMNIAKDFGVSL
jgi:hypothetical protein